MPTLPGYLLRGASAASIAELSARLEPLGVTTTEVSLLLPIAANPGITQSALCRTLGIQRANMAPLVGRLESRNLVARQQMDGRSQGLALTDKGRAISRRAAAVVRAHETELIARVPDELRPAVVPILMALWRTPPTAD